MRRGRTPTMNAMAEATMGPRRRADHMAVHSLLNGPSDEGPPHKCQRTGVDRDVWGPRNKEAMATFESPGQHLPPPPPMGPPGAQNTPRIQNMLNTPEPEKGPPSTGDKRVGCGSTISKIICETCGEGFTCDSLLRKHQAKHTKPFKCKQKGCERQVSGFTSPNDLKRHENSVHKGTKGPAVGFNCIYDHCRDRNKIYFRLDNFRNHLKKLHSTRDPRGMNTFLKQAESECRVEVSPEDVHQESASETNCSSVRSRKNGGSVSISQRKSKKLQWVVTKVDNGNLHRPRPAYYGPLEEDSSDSAMDVDRSDIEATSPGARGTAGMPPISPGLPNQVPGSPIPQDHRRWPSVVPPQDSEALAARKKRMQELESRMTETKCLLEGMRAEYDKLYSENLRELQARGQQLTGPQMPGPEYAPGRGNPQDNRSAALNPRTLEEYQASNGEAINRYVQQSPTEEPGPHPFMPRTKGPKRGGSGGSNRHDSGPEPVNSMLSPPETVASPPGEQPIVPAGLRTQQGRRNSIPSVPHPSSVPRQHIPAPVVKSTNGNSGTRNTNGGPEKTVKCLHPGCKSKFARESELRKHRKRHTRPYGCTARYCQKQFGSKNDWKRHENSQHHRLECWKCSVPVPPYNAGDVCKAVHFRKENFVNHLKSNLHCMKDDQEIKGWAEKAYIGGSNHHVFWCGFCYDDTTGNQGKIIRLKNHGLSGWDERFDHLGSHFEQGQSIRQYVYPEEGAGVGDDCTSFSDEETDEEESVEGQESPSLLHQLATAASSIAQSGNTAADQHERLSAAKVNFGRDDAGTRDSRKLAWYCCQCIQYRQNSHPFLYELHPSCLSCDHQRCSACVRQKIKELG